MTMRLRILRSLGRLAIVSPKHLTSSRCVVRCASVPAIVGGHYKRYLSTPPPHVNQSSLLMEEYHKLSDMCMDSLLEQLEDRLDNMNNSEYEVEYSDAQNGVLTLKLGRKGTYVINKQPPNKQIWLSSPFSGPKRYDYSTKIDDWIYSRDGKTLTQLLNEELGKELEEWADLERV